jgi:transposase-like protein
VETQERAVRMHLDRVAQGDISLLGARREVGELLGVNPSTLRNWIRRGEEPARAAARGESSSEKLSRLRRENAQLRREILRTASAFFAAAEPDRRLGS